MHLEVVCVCVRHILRFSVVYMCVHCHLLLYVEGEISLVPCGSVLSRGWVFLWCWRLHLALPDEVDALEPILSARWRGLGLKQTATPLIGTFIMDALGTKHFVLCREV